MRQGSREAFVEIAANDARLASGSVQVSYEYVAMAADAPRTTRRSKVRVFVFLENEAHRDVINQLSAVCRLGRARQKKRSPPHTRHRDLNRGVSASTYDFRSTLCPRRRSSRVCLESCANGRFQEHAISGLGERPDGSLFDDPRSRMRRSGPFPTAQRNA